MKCDQHSGITSRQLKLSSTHWLRVIQAFSELIKWQHHCYDVWIALQFGHSATELSTRTTTRMFGLISWNAPYSGVQFKATMRSKGHPLFLLPLFTKLHLKFRYRNRWTWQTQKSINPSINSTEQDNNLHKNIIINTISHFNVSLKWLERVIQISEISRFARKTENTAQINSITFDLHIIAFRPIVKCRAIRLLYFMTIIY